MPHLLCHTAGCLLLLLTLPTLSAAQAPVRLQVQPERLELYGPQSKHRLLVTAVAPDGSLRDVTAQAQFQSMQGSTVQVATRGECTAQGDGSTEVRVSFQGLSSTVPVQVSGATMTGPPSFVNDVLPLLTKLGCNQGACHGKGSGQNGFRLSLRGYAPEWDHDWLIHEFGSRRINRAVPEDSLLLRKPLGSAPHEGGKLMQVGSREYNVLLDWIRAGTPGIVKDEPRILKLELLPGPRVYAFGQEQPLLTRAHYNNGVVKDVTWLTQFFVSDGSVAELQPGAVVKMLRPGETAIRAMFQGQVAVTLLTFPQPQTVAAEHYTQRNNFIDEHVFAKLQTLRIEPAALCDDATFIRRVFLDTLGLLPTPDEVRAFLADARPDKRTRLIDAVLERPELVDFWTLQLADLLQNRKESDHDVRGTKGVRSFHLWLREQVAKNRPWDELARDVLTARGGSTAAPAVGYYIVTVGEQRHGEQSPVVASVAQAFLGTRIGCAQCHNHPTEKYTQDDYYHFAAYFSRIKMKRTEAAKGETLLEVSHPDQNQNKSPVGVNQPRTNQRLQPQPLDRSATPVQPGDDPRDVLAKWITAPGNDLFAGAMVNRLWAHFFAVGLVEPIDDLRASNPPTNPALWDALVKEFARSKFDRKHMLRAILNSRTYQLSSATKPSNARDTRFYSHYYARRLPAEVLLDGLTQSTNVPEQFPGYPQGIRAVQLPDPALKTHFFTIFGKSDRITACACERNGEVTMPQLLHMQNGSSVTQKIAHPDSRLTQWLKEKRPTPDIVNELFLTTLSRLPQPAELQALQEELRQGETPEAVLRDLFWALLNSKEFAFNH